MHFLGIIIVLSVLAAVSYTSYRVASATYAAIVGKGEVLAGGVATVAFLASFGITLVGIAMALAYFVPFGR